MLRFNTASGKYCCNLLNLYDLTESDISSFNTASGKYCCNWWHDDRYGKNSTRLFQYRKR